MWENKALNLAIMALKRPWKGPEKALNLCLRSLYEPWNFIIKNSPDIVGKKLLMLIKRDFSFSHINFGSCSPQKMNMAYMPQSNNAPFIIHL